MKNDNSSRLQLYAHIDKLMLYFTWSARRCFMSTQFCTHCISNIEKWDWFWTIDVLTDMNYLYLTLCSYQITRTYANIPYQSIHFTIICSSIFIKPVLLHSNRTSNNSNKLNRIMVRIKCTFQARETDIVKSYVMSNIYSSYVTKFMSAVSGIQLCDLTHLQTI